MSDNISRQAAIDAIDRIFDRCEEIEAHLPEGDPDRTGYKMYPDYMTVWEYLHQVPSAEPNPFCALADRACLFQGKEFVWCLTCPHINEEDRDLVKKAIEPKTGHWMDAEIPLESGGAMPIQVCDQCSTFYPLAHTGGGFHFCPHCGVKMLREDGEA